VKRYFSKMLVAGFAVICAGALVPEASALPVAVKAAPKTATVTGTIDPVSGFLTLSGLLKYTYPKINGTVVSTPAGTTTYTATIMSGGVARTYDVMRPDPAPASAPMLLLLHPNGTSPEAMTNLTEVAPFVATQGFWAVMPAAQNGKWNDDPSISPDNDVQFISDLITALTAQGVNASRVYAAGYSNGGFMSERLACQLPTKVAAFGIDAATLRSGLASVCAPAVQRPKLYILGTSDPIVPYDGIANLYSALNTMAFWTAQQHCGGMVATAIPNIANDNTTVQLNDYTGCTSGQALELYTVTGGGHAWPGGITQEVGTTSQDIDATGLIWLFTSAFHL
jgi:polyhydroxybutyrate depolymerase